MKRPIRFLWAALLAGVLATPCGAQSMPSALPGEDADLWSSAPPPPKPSQPPVQAPDSSPVPSAEGASIGSTSTTPLPGGDVSQDEGLAPQILTSDLVQKQAVASPVLEVTFVLADDDKIVEVLFDGKIEPIKPGTLVMVTKKLHMKEGNNLVEVAAVDEEGHVRKKTFYLYYGGDEMLAGGQGNWLMWATLSVAMGGLMMSESQAVAKLNAKQHDLLAQMAAAGTAAQYNTLNSQLTDTYHQAKEHWNVGAAAMTLSLVFLGTAVYEWANLPESTEPKDQVLFLAPSQDRLTLVYQARF